MRRAHRARQERGAAVFVVVLVVTLLTTLGLFAVRSASLANSASGYNRQMAQVHYVTDYAIHAAMSFVATDPFKVKEQMMKGPGSGDVRCVGFDQLVNAGNQPTCFMLSYDDINAVVTGSDAQNELIELPEPDFPGSLGPAPIDADMRIEMTDLHPALPLRGNEAAGGGEGKQQLRYAYVTLSANGLVRPMQTSAGTWDTQAASAAGEELSRAHAFMGPVLMQK
jgi:hypothetical protein